jgi:YycE-like protein
MYVAGLGFTVIAQFVDHEGFDGGSHQRSSPGLFLPAENEWEESCTRMLKAGFRAVLFSNPYWDRKGRTFEDVDGYRVVLENDAWSG